MIIKNPQKSLSHGKPPFPLFSGKWKIAEKFRWAGKKHFPFFYEQICSCKQTKKKDPKRYEIQLFIIFSGEKGLITFKNKWLKIENVYFLTDIKQTSDLYTSLLSSLSVLLSLFFLSSSKYNRNLIKKSFSMDIFFFATLLYKSLMCFSRYRFVSERKKQIPNQENDGGNPQEKKEESCYRNFYTHRFSNGSFYHVISISLIRRRGLYLISFSFLFQIANSSDVRRKLIKTVKAFSIQKGKLQI